MKERLEKRLKELHAEFESGQKMLAELEGKQTNVRNTLLRISGAMQVLQEELEKLQSAAVPEAVQPHEHKEQRLESYAEVAHS